MPNFDCGAYFLSTLIPVRTETIGDPEGKSGTSPVHALRDALSKLPTARQTPFSQGQSPFAKNTRNHLARLVVIEDVAYVGRKPINALLTVLTELLLPPRLHINPVNPQPQDHLSNPFLFFSADFDAASGDDGERDSYLKELWETSSDELRGIFQYCVGFETVGDASGFAAYIARCQLETTMPFHDYFMDGVPLAALPEMSLAKLGGIWLGVALLAFAPLHWLLWAGDSCLALLIKAAAALFIGWLAVFYVVKNAGVKAFPPAPDSTLPMVLKSLYLRNEFTRFVIDNQMLSVAEDEESARLLQEKFAQFVAAHKPDDVEQPTQEAGVVGI
jgi:hypothetical protein